MDPNPAKTPRSSRRSKSNPEVRVHTTGTSGADPSIVSTDEVDVRIRDQILERNGFVILGCGCFIRVDLKALLALPAKAILEATCQSAGTCSHTRPH